MGRGQVIAITGASGGIGRETAIEFARQGPARVALLARGHDGLEGAVGDVEAAGADALSLAVDVTDADEVERAAATVEERLGTIDAWVNNAMATVFSGLLEITGDEYRR